MCLTCTIEEITGLDLSTDEGHESLEKLGRIPWPEVTDQMEEVLAYIAALYKNPAGGTGGPLHVVVDDYNVDDESLSFCRGQMKEWTPYDCTADDGIRVLMLSGWILDLLEPMSVIERSVTIALAHGNLATIFRKVYMPSTEFPIREDVLDEHGNIIGTQWGFRSRKVRG